jgi:peptide subunit release factor RF-3
VAVSPRTNDDRENFQRALTDLAQQDPTIRIKTDPIDGQTIISGMGELHLEAICDRIMHEYKIQLDVGKRKVFTWRPFAKGGERLPQLDASIRINSAITARSIFRDLRSPFATLLT